jgi:hypothetical protein
VLNSVRFWNHPFRPTIVHEYHRCHRRHSLGPLLDGCRIAKEVEQPRLCTGSRIGHNFDIEKEEHDDRRCRRPVASGCCLGSLPPCLSFSLPLEWKLPLQLESNAKGRGRVECWMFEDELASGKQQRPRYCVDVLRKDVMVIETFAKYCSGVRVISYDQRHYTLSRSLMFPSYRVSCRRTMITMQPPHLIVFDSIARRRSSLTHTYT